MHNIHLKMRGRKRQLFFIFVFCLILSGCKKEYSYYRTSGEIFKTYYHIQYKYNRVLDKEIQDCFQKFDLSLNPFNKESIIYKVNNNMPVEKDDPRLELDCASIAKGYACDVIANLLEKRSINMDKYVIN